MSDKSKIKLKVPQQDMAAPSQFNGTPQGLQAWLDNLPMANLGRTSRDLYRMTTELNHVRLDPERRIKLLEMLRETIRFACRGLSKHYLKQPIVLPEQPRKVYRLAYTLVEQLVSGYTLCATQLASKFTYGHRHSAALALHRAITELSNNLLRTYQLYQDQPEGIWSTLHNLYQLALQLNVADHKVEDRGHESTIAQNYSRCLLLGSARCNQLRQDDMEHVYEALNHWQQLVKLEHTDQTATFAVNLDSDDPPIHSELITPAQNNERFLSLNTYQLIEYLTQLRIDSADSALRINDNGVLLSPNLINHLALSWGILSKRNFIRHESNDRLDIALGLSACHYFIAGEQSFDHFIDNKHSPFAIDKENLFLRAKGSTTDTQRDIWDTVYTSNIGKANVSMESIDYQLKQEHCASHSEHTNAPQLLDVQTVNISAGGYCVSWPEDDLSTLKTGEVVAIRERNHNNWSLGEVRWIRHQPNEETQLGIELLSATGIPYGARMINRSGPPTDYMRVLMLPEVKSIGRPVTLLTPRVPFSEGKKVELTQHGEGSKIQLTRCVASSASFALFEFSRLEDGFKPSTTEDTENDEFDSLWNSL